MLALTILIYGGGYGIMWIARGTLPLALFGPERYATLMGRLAFPSLIVQALAPSLGALLIEQRGALADDRGADGVRGPERFAGGNAVDLLPPRARRSLASGTLRHHRPATG